MPGAAAQIGAAVNVLPLSRSPRPSPTVAADPAEFREQAMTAGPQLTQHKITVLLIDDQPMIGEARPPDARGRGPDIVFHYCKDRHRAVDVAIESQPDGDPARPGDARHRRPAPGEAFSATTSHARDAA